MKVFKFGGASVKDAKSVKNVALVLESQGFEHCILIVSAMGKTTNALEKVVALYFQKGNYKQEIDIIKQNHIDIAKGIFCDEHSVFQEIALFFDDLEAFLRRNKSPNYSFVYDQVVSSGELISSKILSEYLNEKGFINQWLDVRDFIKTDDTYQEAEVNWQQTEELIRALPENASYVTQGFIGSDGNNFTTTLGREGSDYTAAVFAYCTDAEAMTIWKDVPGVMTGDPRKFENVSLLSNISYEEAIEMAYYGASVIHPKTLQPLQQKNIPFFVKSFLKPEEKGTKISLTAKNELTESYILKNKQTLIRIATRDFSFIAEDHISHIFQLLNQSKIRVSLMQNSAISLALCLEDPFGNIDVFNAELSRDFHTELVKDVSLFTVRNTDLKDLHKFYKNKKVLLEQISRNTLQMVTQ